MDLLFGEEPDVVKERNIKWSFVGFLKLPPIWDVAQSYLETRKNIPVSLCSMKCLIKFQDKPGLKLPRKQN